MPIPSAADRNRAADPEMAAWLDDMRSRFGAKLVRQIARRRTGAPNPRRRDDERKRMARLPQRSGTAMNSDHDLMLRVPLAELGPVGPPGLGPAGSRARGQRHLHGQNRTSAT